jgi:hypothetical protein
MQFVCFPQIDHKKANIAIHWRILFSGKLKGMNEHSTKFPLPAVYADPKTISQRVFEAANVACIPGVEPAVMR